jgi:hypothetical protein
MPPQAIKGPVAMSDVDITPSEIVVGLLRLFPPSLRVSILDVGDFRREFGLNVSAKVQFQKGGLTFDRSVLYNAIRRLLGKETDREVINSEDGTAWGLTPHSSGDGLLLEHDGKKMQLPDFTCLSPEREQRIKWFKRESEKFLLVDESAKACLNLLATRAIDDDEVDGVLSEIQLSPLYIHQLVSTVLRNETIDVPKLVPDDIRYYERLVGPGEESDLKGFIESIVKPHITRLLRWSSVEGFKQSLLMSSHAWIALGINFDLIPREQILKTFEWLAQRGDSVSRLGSIECGLTQLDRYPELESTITRMIRTFLDDDPEDEQGRFALLSSLIVLVEGEFARTGIARGRPPFWRRLAAIAHASVIERAIVTGGISFSTFGDWIAVNRGLLYYMQTSAGLRQEPRWLPEFVQPSQLKAEFLGRIAAAAQTNDGKIRFTELRTLLFEENGIKSEMEFPFPYLPGPLEGGVASTVDMPAEIDTEFRAGLESEGLSPRSFARLVNSSLIFTIGPQLAQLTTQALRRVKYQLRDIGAQGDGFSLLSGLAIVAAVTRSSDLSDDVRVLARVVRRRPGFHFSPNDLLRIGLIAAAAHENAEKWRGFVGDWVNELAFEEMTGQEAARLCEQVRLLCHLDPDLWATCSRGHAACEAFAASAVA